MVCGSVTAKERALIASALLFVILLLSSSCASTASSPACSQSSVYQFAATPVGLLRLNQQTGETHVLFQGSWVAVRELDLGLDSLLRSGLVPQ